MKVGNYLKLPKMIHYGEEKGVILNGYPLVEEKRRNGTEVVGTSV